MKLKLVDIFVRKPEKNSLFFDLLIRQSLFVIKFVSMQRKWNIKENDVIQYKKDFYNVIESDASSTDVRHSLTSVRWINSYAFPREMHRNE